MSEGEIIQCLFAIFEFEASRARSLKRCIPSRSLQFSRRIARNNTVCTISVVRSALAAPATNSRYS